jgi:hypothetical protein
MAPSTLLMARDPGIVLGGAADRPRDDAKSVDIARVTQGTFPNAGPGDAPQSEDKLLRVSSAGRDPPAIVARIMEPADAIPPALFGRCKHRRRAGGHCSFEYDIHILDVCEMNAWASWVCRTRFALHHDRVADLNLGVLYSALRRDLPLAAFDRAEHVVEKTDQPFDSFNDEVWIDAVIPVWWRGPSDQVLPSRQ